MKDTIVLDKEKIDSFWNARTRIQDRRIATNYRDDGRLQLDVDFVRNYVSVNSSVLDMGAGTCTLSIKLLPFTRKVVAVEKFAGFLHGLQQHENLQCIVSDVVEYQSAERFDVILLFGVANFLTICDELRLYENISSLLSYQGTLIVKNQCGVAKEVVVDKYSEELQQHYHARYPHVDSQHEILGKFFDVERLDIYPPNLNRWQDTHFYAFVCTRKGIKKYESEQPRSSLD